MKDAEILSYVTHGYYTKYWFKAASTIKYLQR